MAPTKEIATRSSTQATAIDPEQTLKASKALLAHIKKTAAEKEAAADKKTLLGDDDEVPIWLQMTTKRHIAATNRLKPGKIYLPHSLNTNEHLSICLIAADNTKDQIKAALESDDFPKTVKVEKVIEYTSLSKKYSQYENQRKLLAEYDIFLGDDRIINRLPKGALPKI
jgi:ribosome biogenesis protein UTP30